MAHIISKSIFCILKKIINNKMSALKKEFSSKTKIAKEEEDASKFPQG
jgi:hypothetical protein